MLGSYLIQSHVAYIYRINGKSGKFGFVFLETGHNLADKVVYVGGGKDLRC